MEKLLEYITKNITGKKVSVKKTNSGDLVIYTITAPQDIMGMLIGKQGRTIRAIRALARARAIIDEENVAVKLEEKSVKK